MLLQKGSKSPLGERGEEFFFFLVHPVTHVTPDTSTSQHTIYFSSSINL